MNDPDGREVPRAFAFGPYVLVPEQLLLLEFGKPVRVGGRALDILTILASRAGELVTKRELMAHVWPGLVVEEGNLKVNMASLRRTLDEVTESPKYIATVVGRGYRFIGEVRPMAVPAPSPRVSAIAPLGYKLPTGAARVVGRKKEIVAVRQALGETRLVSIVGPGGIGKTTVALAVAQLVEDEGDTAVSFVDLARVSSEEFVSPSLMSALGVNFGGDDSLQAIISIFERRKLLIVLDTCEHLLKAVAHVCEVLLARTRNVRILTTSRQSLQVHGEKVKCLGPLDIPPLEVDPTVEAILKFSAPELLTERAFETTGYRPQGPDVRAIAEICRRLDGSPLALELVSSRLAGRSAEVVLQELDHRFRTLRRDIPGGPFRQQTLLATLEWSYSLLTKAEATALRALSIFASSFDQDSAAAVLGAHNLAQADIHEAIAGLSAKSMLSVDHTSGPVRYRLLDTTRAFASELLESYGELAAVSENHARHLLQVLAHSSEQRSGHMTFGGLADDLRKAIDWALYRAGEPHLGVQLVAAGLPVWRELSLGEESRRNCERAVAEVERIGSIDASLKLQLMIGLGSANTYLSTDPQRTIGHLKTATSLAREAGDPSAECRLLGTLVTYQFLPGHESDVPQTLRAMQQAAIRTNRRSAIWEHEQRVAEWESLTCDFGHAIPRLEMLRSEMRGTFEDPSAAVFTTYQKTKVEVHLGALLWLTGQPGQAIRITEEAASVALENLHGSTLIYCLTHGIIWTLNESHFYTQATYYAELLKRTVYRHGMATWTPIANCYSEAIAALSGARQSPEGLRSAFQGLCNGTIQLGYHSYFATVAKAMIAIGEMEDAARTIDYILDAGAQPWTLPEFLRLRAATERAFGRDGDAATTLRESMRLAIGTGCRAWNLRSALDLTTLLKDQGRVLEARELLTPAFSEFKDGFDTGDLRRAREILAKLR